MVKLERVRLIRCCEIPGNADLYHFVRFYVTGLVM
eukprot:UN16119